MAQIAASVINHSFSPPKPRVKIKDLMPSRMKPEAAPKYQSRQRIAENIAKLMDGFMGNGKA